MDTPNILKERGVFSSMPHIHDKIDFCVEVFIVHNNKVLLRKHDKYKIWLSVGGHIELDEDPTQAALREVKEEVGLEVELVPKEQVLVGLIPPVFLTRHKINEHHEHVVLIYFARAKTDQLVLSDSEQSDGCKWFTLEELDDPVFGIIPDVVVCAKAALDAVGIYVR